jgi:hypothetical protein
MYVESQELHPVPKRRKKRSRANHRAWLKRQGLNEHHRTPRCRNGGRAHADLNIAKVGIQLHRVYHMLFGTKLPEAVCLHINTTFTEENESLVVVSTRDFATFHRYFTSRHILPLRGMASYGVTWGHLFLYGSRDDLYGTFRHGRHLFAKFDPPVDSVCRWHYLFGEVSLAVMAYELTKHWLPLSVVVVAVPKAHLDEVLAFISNLAGDKNKSR